MFAAGFVLRLLEYGVADIDLALLAPEPGLGLLGFFGLPGGIPPRRRGLTYC